jgi:hypothetical protein
MEALERASSRYQSVLETSEDDRVLNRARLGMARIYEIRNEPEKARDEYLKVTGAYAKYAKDQAKRLATPESKETYAWLAKAEPKFPRSMPGLGGPAGGTDFSAAELALPSDSPEGGMPTSTPADGESIEELLQGLNLPTDAVDQKSDGSQLPSSAPGQPGTPPAENPTPEQGAAAPADQPPPQGESAPAQATAPTDNPADNSSDSQTGNENAETQQSVE